MAPSRTICVRAEHRRTSASACALAFVAEPRVLAIFGPTASGKSAIAEALAERLPARLISADAMQVFRGVPVLTNQSQDPVELVAIWELDHETSVGEYAELAHRAVDSALEDGLTPIVVGGTGLYLRAALADLQLPPAPAAGARERWERAYDELGPRRAHELLAERDPDAAARVHPNDRRRIVRALELADTGSSLAPGEGRLWSEEMRHPTLAFGLEVPRHELDRRIAQRTRTMFERGAAEEARRALAGPISTTARTIHGLLEAAELPQDEAIEALARRTRRYASYQRKWMRRLPGLVSLPADRPPGEVADAILEMARARQRLPAGPALGPGGAADA
jgi:tRNA dimethylallyltransferase